MQEYIVIFMIIAIFSLINIKVKKENLKIAYGIVGIILIIFIGFRKDLGGIDYDVYKEYFKGMHPIYDMANWNYPDVFGFGFKYLNSIIKTFTENSYVMFFIVTILTVPVMLIFNYKYCKYPFFTLAFYVYKTMLYTNFIALRQSIAMMIFFIAFKYILNGNLKKYTIFIVVATLFHSSAIILWPLYFVRYLKLYEWSIFKSIAVGYLLGLVADGMIKIGTKVLLLLPLNQARINNIISYTNSVDTGLDLHLIEILMLSVLFIFVCQRKKSEDKIILNIFIVYMILIITFGKYLIFMRISMYFYGVIMILLSKVIEDINFNKNIIRIEIKPKSIITKIQNNIEMVMCLGFLILFFLGYLNFLIKFDNGGLLPYQNILF